MHQKQIKSVHQISNLNQSYHTKKNLLILYFLFDYKIYSQYFFQRYDIPNSLEVKIKMKKSEKNDVCFPHYCRQQHDLDHARSRSPPIHAVSPSCPVSLSSTSSSSSSSRTSCHSSPPGASVSPVDSEEGGEIRGPCVSSPCVFLSGAPRDSSVLRGPSWRAGFDNFGFDSSIPRHSISLFLPLSLFFLHFQIPDSSKSSITINRIRFSTVPIRSIENYYLRYPSFVIRGTRVERSSSRVKKKIDYYLRLIEKRTIVYYDKYRRRWKVKLFLDFNSIKRSVNKIIIIYYYCIKKEVRANDY